MSGNDLLRILMIRKAIPFLNVFQYSLKMARLAVIAMELSERLLKVGSREWRMAKGAIVIPG